MLVGEAGFEPASPGFRRQVISRYRYSPISARLTRVTNAAVIASTLAGAGTGAGVSDFAANASLVVAFELNGELLCLCHDCLASYAITVMVTSVRIIRSSKNLVDSRGIEPRSDALQAPAMTTLAQSPLVGDRDLVRQSRPRLLVLAPRRGVEPRTLGRQPSVLPLNYQGVRLLRERI